MAEFVGPPQAVEVEKHVIGGLMLGDQEAYTVFDRLQPEDFYLDSHRVLFEAQKALYQRSATIDVLTTKQELETSGRLQDVGGEAYLLEISAEVVSAVGVDDYCAILKDKSERRRLIRDSSVLYEAARNTELSNEDVKSIAESRILEGSVQSAESGPVSAKKSLISTLSLIERCHAGELQGLQTQFDALNQLTGGICQPDLIVLAGRPAAGKTTFAFDIADYLATDKKKSVLAFELEMTKEQVMQRLICRRQGIDFQLLRTGRLSGHHFVRVSEAVASLVDSGLYIDDYCEANPARILSLARRHKAKHGLDLILIDNLSLMDADRFTGNRLQDVTYITKKLKVIAKLLGVPIIVLVHLSRAIEGRGENAVPRKSDLRECGSIEQDADMIWALHKPELDSVRVDLHILKQRNGPEGVLPLTADFSHMRFQQYSGAHEFIQR